MSFTYFQDDDGSLEWQNEEAVDAESEIDGALEDDVETDLEAARSSAKSTRTFYSRSSVEDPLLSRHDSVSSCARGRRAGGRLNQKIYIVTEDLTAVIAGFSTSTSGFIFYIALCIFSFGAAYLVFRWLPRWRVRLIGSPTPLWRCQWVAIEVSISRCQSYQSSAKSSQDQWNQFTVHPVSSQEYGRPISTVFGGHQTESMHLEFDEDNDPVLESLRFLEYRYLRFFYQPLEDKFLLVNGWKDPRWTNVKAMRGGLDADERDSREQVFGQNLIDIKQKSIPQLLIDEVSSITRNGFSQQHC